MIYKVSTKDWERMQDLLDRNQDGEGVAAKIKDANKAAARFVAGTILAKDAKKVIEYDSISFSYFRAFGRKALALGATKEDLFESLANVEVPADWKDSHVTKENYTGYTGSLRRLLDQLRNTYKIEIEMKTLTDGYRYWSGETHSSYNRNGRVWPLNYELIFKNGDKTMRHTVIVVTNEGGGNYGYDFDCVRWPWSMVKIRLENCVKTFITK